MEKGSAAAIAGKILKEIEKCNSNSGELVNSMPLGLLVGLLTAITEDKEFSNSSQLLVEVLLGCGNRNLAIPNSVSIAIGRDLIPALRGSREGFRDLVGSR